MWTVISPSTLILMMIRQMATHPPTLFAPIVPFYCGLFHWYVHSLTFRKHFISTEFLDQKSKLEFTGAFWVVLIHSRSLNNAPDFGSSFSLVWFLSFWRGGGGGDGDAFSLIKSGDLFPLLFSLYPCKKQQLEQKKLFFTKFVQKLAWTISPAAFQYSWVVKLKGRFFSAKISPIWSDMDKSLSPLEMDVTYLRFGLLWTHKRNICLIGIVLGWVTFKMSKYNTCRKTFKNSSLTGWFFFLTNICQFLLRQQMQCFSTFAQGWADVASSQRWSWICADFLLPYGPCWRGEVHVRQISIFENEFTCVVTPIHLKIRSNLISFFGIFASLEQLYIQRRDQNTMSSAYNE